MVSKNDFFIGVYTHECKDYCDKEFFETLNKISEGVMTYIVDNSPTRDYYTRLRNLTHSPVIKINVEKEPKGSLFQRNVRNSVNTLRDLFLTTDKEYFFTIESDVIPPYNVLDLLIDDISSLYAENWGILGGLYYKGFHNYDLKGLQKTNHVLSGCTVYKREVLERIPFRYDETNLAPFPDAWMSIDAGKEYSLWNDHDIICEHLHTKHGTRMSKSL